MQDRPVCYECNEQIDHDWVFEAPCGHDGHPSAAFHGLCLMAFREKRESAPNPGVAIFVGWILEHTEHDPRFDN